MLIFFCCFIYFLEDLSKFKLSAALKYSKVFSNVPKTCFSGVVDFQIDIFGFSKFLSFIVFVKSQPYKVNPSILYLKPKILNYLCMNTIFSESMQDTETNTRARGVRKVTTGMITGSIAMLLSPPSLPNY